MSDHAAAHDPSVRFADQAFWPLRGQKRHAPSRIPRRGGTRVAHSPGQIALALAIALFLIVFLVVPVATVATSPSPRRAPARRPW